MHSFDQEAPQYDAHFSERLIGQKQRSLVWRLLLDILPKPPVNVLETNAGTGTDGLFLQELGYDIQCSDASLPMVGQAVSKGLPAFVWDLNQAPPDHLSMNSFEAILSNFSGWNCLAPERLKPLGKELYQLTAPNGQLVVVVFGKRCLWESGYFFLTGRWKKVFRRSRTMDTAKMNGVSFPVWYHSSATMAQQLAPHFQLIKTYPIGVFLPPSYLSRLNRFPRLLHVFYRLDMVISKFSFLSEWADHTLLVFRRQTE